MLHLNQDTYPNKNSIMNQNTPHFEVGYLKSVWIEQKSKGFLAFILFLQFIVYAVVFFDVPVVRQIVLFLYLTFVPGFVIVKILRMDKLDGLETVLFSVGLSIAFLMFAGLVINELGFMFDISQPLSQIPLMIILNIFVTVAAVFVYLRSSGVKSLRIATPEFSPVVLLLLALPILSIVGALQVNAYGNNLILMIMIIIISLLFATGVLSKKLFPPKLYPLALFVISLSLLYQICFVSNYILPLNSDVSREYFIFRTTQKNAYWVSTNPFGDIRYGRTYSMLSVTILPTIYSNLLNLDPALVFKILYPLIFSFVPLGLYKMWKSSLGKKYAFISVFFFMSVSTFFTEMLGLNKQIIAELFLVLLLLTIFSKKMKLNTKMACFMIFSFALITSHYAIAEIFAFFILFALILLIVMRQPHRNITIAMVVFFFVLMFFWYVYTSGSSAFNSIASYSEYVFNSMGDFFNLGARQPEVLRGLGLETPPTIWNAVSRVFAYATEALIVAGFIGLITRRVKIHWDRDLSVLTLVAMGLIASLALVPGLADTLNMTRFYHILLFFLAPLCAIGAGFLVGLAFKRNRKRWACTFLLIVLIPYFLFQTGFVYELTGSESWSLPLGKYRMSTYKLSSMGYVSEQEVFSAQWCSKNVEFQNTQLYIDVSSNVLLSYGNTSIDDAIRLTNVTSVTQNGIVYLSRVNVIEGIIIGDNYAWNRTDFSILNDMNRIYSNGESEIYKNIP